MSATLTENVTPETENEEVEDFDLSTPDGVALAIASRDARVEEQDVPALMAAMETLRAVGKKAGSVLVNLTNRRHEIASVLAEIRGYIVLPSGFPAWNATHVPAYSEVVERVLFESFGENVDEATRKRELTNIRQLIKTTHLVVAIKSYVLRHDFAGSPQETEEQRDEIMSTEAFRLAVRRQYVGAGLSIPENFRTEEDKAKAALEKSGKSGPGQGTSPTAMDAVRQGLSGLTDYAIARVADAALMATSTLATRLMAAGTGEVKDRPYIAKVNGRIHGIASLTAKLIDGKEWTEDDASKLTALLWSAKDEKSS